MSDVPSLERRMRGLRVVRDILSSLRALSSLQLRRAQDELHNRREFEAELRAAVGAVAAPLPMAKTPSSVLLLVFGADQGFCGPLVKRVVSVALRRLADAPPCAPLAIGLRTRELLEAARGAPVTTLPSTASVRSVEPLARAVAAAVERRLAAGEVDGIEAVHARHGAPGRYEVDVVRVFPVDPARLPARPSAPMRLQEPPQDVLRRLLFEWVYAELYRIVLEAQASEHGARLTTTDAATRSIDEALEGLRAEHHRARQEEVTAEVQEIVSAAEVMLHPRGEAS